MTNRLAFFVPSLDGGGAERVVATLASRIADRGVPVDLVLTRRDGPYLRDVSSAVHVVDLGRRHTARALPDLIRYLKVREPSVLFSALSTAHLAAAVACRIAAAAGARRTRHIATVHVHPHVYGTEPSSLRGWLTTRLLPYALRHADAVVCVSHGVADGVAAWTGRNRSDVDVIYNPIEVDAIRSRSESVPHPWFEAGDPVVVTAGRLVRAKDVASLVKAIGRLNERRPVRLIVLGEGPERDALQAQIAASDLTDRVHLTGFVSNPYAYFQHADVFALASTHEAFGNVVVEALACGCPVVCTRARGGVAEILHDPRTEQQVGHLVPPKDPGALADAIEAALAEPHDASRSRRRARDFHAARAVDAYLRLAGVSRQVVQDP